MIDSPFRHESRRGLAGGAPLMLLHGGGQVRIDGGHAFFRRHPDRTLDRADLAAWARELCGFIAEAIGRSRAA